MLNELQPKTGYDLMTVPADGGAVSVLLDGPRSDRTPAVSPDGRWIAYQSDRSAGEKSWDVAPDGRFLMRKALRAEYSINVVLNWADELKSKVRPK